jgi:hypothetical protein
MNEVNDDALVEKQANSAVLYTALCINIVLMLYAIYLSGSVLVSIAQDVSIASAMWQMTTESGMILHGIAILTMLAIGILNAANRAIGAKSPIIEKIARILLKLPINIILVLLALFFGFMGYGKFEVGVVGANVNGGGYVLDWITVASLMFLVFFVKKV